MQTNPEIEKFKNAFSQGKSIFLTGKAGTGKTTLLKGIIAKTAKNTVILAPTGIAAINIGGATIHSFFKFPLKPIIPNGGSNVPMLFGESVTLIKKLDVLIIDEVSMVRADILDAIDASLRKNGGNPNEPFGGKQVILIGDAFQLEPVFTAETSFLKSHYGNSLYFFNAYAYKELEPIKIELKTVYRQSDDIFLDILNRIRIGEQSDADLAQLNKRVGRGQGIELTTTNLNADRKNQVKLTALQTQSFKFKAEIVGKFEESKYPVPYEIVLKKDAQVMFVRNDMGGRWVNGTIGKVTEISKYEITVLLQNGETHIVEKCTWENTSYAYDAKEKRIISTKIGAFTQFPLKLAWSVTIHKSQGLTFDKVNIDFWTGAFAAGQAYVALSRCTSLEGLRLSRAIRHSDIIVENKIKGFYQDF